MDASECRAKAQAYLDRLTSTPNYVYVRATNQRVAVPRPRLEIIETRETPDVVLFSYDAEADPQTGEREEMGGNLPLAVDRVTGNVETAAVKVLAEFWPSSIGVSAAEEAMSTSRKR